MVRRKFRKGGSSMTIIFSRNKQHADDIKLALSLDAPLIIDNHITILNLNSLYEWLQTIDKVVDGTLYMDDFIKDILFKGQKEGRHLYEFRGFSIAYDTTKDDNVMFLSFYK